jgi:hypothetical protein
VFSIKFDDKKAADVHATWKKHMSLLAATYRQIVTINWIVSCTVILKLQKSEARKNEAIVKNVLCPFSMNRGVDKLNNPSPCPFSVSTDASNKDNRKIFPLTVRFFFYVNAGDSDYLLQLYEETNN